MRLLKNGTMFCLAIAIASCRGSKPPVIEVCIGDGFGGADCVEADGSKKYRAPSELRDYWMTSEADEQNFASWCYDVNRSYAAAGMVGIKSNIHRSNLLTADGNNP